ncbi:MAG: ribosome-associated translation inhibitor RaiA [Chloroflexi bacterium]|nr:ribosome-associated translation inhibitor RaiA [Chloroflexota bacterium]
MELTIHSKNVELNEGVRNHVNRKLGQLTKHLPGIVGATVEFALEPTRSQKHRIVAQVTLKVNGSVLRAEQRAASTTAAINAAADVLDRRIEKFKSRVYRSQRARHTPALGVQEAEQQVMPVTEAEESTTLPDGELVRIKGFEMDPITVAEAAVQMRLLGHTFFMFLNAESGGYNLLYLRDDGDYGLIQPKSG